METLRVLVTDDEFGMRLGVARTLRDFTVRVADVNVDVGFAVEQAESGEEAMEKIARQPPDILLLDHKMPGISGLEVLDRLAGMQTDILTIMITAYASIETAVTATKRGAYDFLAKPFTPDELKSTIHKTAAHLILARQARKLTEEKRQVRFEFIRVLGHELKAPLNAVAGYLELIKGRQLGDQLPAYAEMIDRSLVRIDGMRKLIRDLLDLTQIESGRKNRRLDDRGPAGHRPGCDGRGANRSRLAEHRTAAAGRRRRAHVGRRLRNGDDHRATCSRTPSSTTMTEAAWRPPSPVTADGLS